ncbi:unnamed protein product [Merluccius merluccius]
MMKKEIHLSLDAQQQQQQEEDEEEDAAQELSKSGDGGGGGGLLGSPDLGLLKLASPDLERLIIQSNGMVVASAAGPAAAAVASHFLYPKSASDEQEFAEGFVKALEDLHKQNQLSEASSAAAASCVSVVDRLDLLGSGGSGSASASVGLQQASDLPVYTTLNGYAAATISYPSDAIPYPPPPPPPHHMPDVQHQHHQQQHQHHHQQAAAALSRLQAAGMVKDEPQTVPDMQSFGDSPPLSPIDMDNQERIKAERKKLRNRIAASKCRKRKLERISRLEDKVKSLKTQNTELASTASVLREQVAQLKQKVMNHVSNGCQLLPNQVQAY